ncbi:MAG: sugar ABC transporter substrate-binding protein [Spirochaetes bacterium]|nr:MAG: sugar ABC transporter substrate-binding protein [Spirochaetota bacterium]RKX98828.1 MAG: sugar ABC transporter substrate-binding protein [Spirochaetota bacterium]
MSRNGMKMIVVLLLAVGIVTTAFANGQGEDADDDGAYKYVAIAKSMDNPAFQVAEQGARDRVAELDGVSLEWTAPTAADPANMVQMIESYIQRGVDGMLIDSLGPSITTAINQAVDAGIPVVMFDSDNPESKRTAYVGSDNYQGGYLCGEMYVKAVKGNGKQYIAILTGVPGALNLQERDKGFKEALNDAGVDYEIVVTVPGNDDLTQSVEAVENTLRGNEKINGFFFDGPWPLLVDSSNLPLMMEKTAAGELTVVSFDTLQQELAYVADGTVIGLVGQKYYGWGYHGLTVLHEIVANGAKYPEIVNTGVDIVTKDGTGDAFTVEEFNKFWDNFSFNEKPIMPEDL